jgi:hypothetical protein
MAWITRLNTLVTVMQGYAQGELAMLRRHLYLHYRVVREAITAVVTVGAALLLSYLILKARL